MAIGSTDSEERVERTPCSCEVEGSIETDHRRRYGLISRNAVQLGLHRCSLG